MSEISEAVKTVIRNTAKKLKGTQKREFIAEVTMELLDGNARKAEREFGWGRETVKKGIRELTTSIKCIDNYAGRGNKKTEEKLPDLPDDMRKILGEEGCIEPRYHKYFRLGKITAKAVRQALIGEFGYTDAQLPNENTIGNILNRLGYQMGSVLKSGDSNHMPGSGPAGSGSGSRCSEAGKEGLSA